MKKTSNKPSQGHVQLLLALAAGGILTQAATSIYAQITSTTIFACVRKPGGLVRIVERRNDCLPSETRISWNQEGPIGPTGPAGVAGATGASGAAGAAGSGGLGGFGGFATDQLIGYDNSQEPMRFRYFAGANFTNAAFVSEVRASDFSHANFTNSTWDEVSVTASNFSEANFSNSKFAISDQGSNFSGANFTDADLSINNNDDERSRFTNSNFTKAIFTNADVDNVLWVNVTCPDGTNSDDHGNTCEGHLQS